MATVEEERGDGRGDDADPDAPSARDDSEGEPDDREGARGCTTEGGIVRL